MLAATRVLLPVAAIACWLLPSAIHATGCVKEIVVPIRFQPAAVCWRHVGSGTTFIGQFGANQHITASAIGQTSNSDGTRSWVTTGPWQLSVTGPGGFFAADSGNGQLDIVLSRAGQYSFSIG
ncbi:MAG: hypothetical protein ACLP1D_12485, partial [Xanthobacteraceae bacterium]